MTVVPRIRASTFLVALGAVASLLLLLTFINGDCGRTKVNAPGVIIAFSGTLDLHAYDPNQASEVRIRNYFGNDSYGVLTALQLDSFELMLVGQNTNASELFYRIINYRTGVQRSIDIPVQSVAEVLDYSSSLQTLLLRTRARDYVLWNEQKQESHVVRLEGCRELGINIDAAYFIQDSLIAYSCGSRIVIADLTGKSIRYPSVRGKIACVSFDGKRIALVSPGEGKKMSLELWEIDSDSTVWLANDDNIHGCTFSPDGEWLAYRQITKDLMNRVKLKLFCFREMKAYDPGEEVGRYLMWVPDVGGEAHHPE